MPSKAPPRCKVCGLFRGPRPHTVAFHRNLDWAATAHLQKLNRRAGERGKRSLLDKLRRKG